MLENPGDRNGGNMQNQLPKTPSDGLRLPGPIQLVVNGICKSAEILGYWKRPYKNAATSYEEMSFLDICYWFYKNTNPITKPEHQTYTFESDASVVRLPNEFKKEQSITIGAAGDLIQSENLEKSRDILYEGISDILFDQDISYASLEVPISVEEPEKQPLTDKTCPTEYSTVKQFDAFKGYKDKCFTVLHTATNHMFDAGTEGVETTKHILQENGILDVGTNNDPEDFARGTILVKNDIKIGFASAGFGLNGHEMSQKESHRIHTARLLPKNGVPELDILRKQIDDCKAQHCDFIIASIHWGFEFECFPRKCQVDSAHQLVEWGADAIIGHHPHVIQPIEYYRTKRDPDRVAVIAHSLGSLAWTCSAPYLVLSAILNLTLSKGAMKSKDVTYIEKASTTPVFRDYEDSNGTMLTRILKLADHLMAHDDVNRQNHIAEIKKYADLVLGEHSYTITQERPTDTILSKVAA